MALTDEQQKADKNKDGVLSDKEVKRYNKKNPEKPLADTFTVEDAMAEYGYTVAVINADSDLKELFTLATQEEWSAARFEAKVMDWARNAGLETATALKSWKLEQEGGEPWQRAMEMAQGQLTKKAVELGIPVGDLDLDTAEGQAMVRDWMYGGYQNRTDDAIVTFLAPGGIEGVTGVTADTEDSLRQLALANGVTMSDSWYSQVSESIARGQSDINLWQEEIRTQAASRFPVYADKIKAGVNVRELANPFLQSMERILERTNVDLNDPWIVKALGGRDEKGNPVAMNLYDFETDLRKSPEWTNTTNGKNTLLNTGTKFLKDMGFLSDNAGMVV